MSKSEKTITLVVGSLADSVAEHIKRLGGSVLSISSVPSLYAVVLPGDTVFYSNGVDGDGATLLYFGRPVLVVIPEHDPGDSQWFAWHPALSVDEAKMTMWRR